MTTQLNPIYKIGSKELTKFATTLINKQQDVDEEINDIVNKEFFNLIDMEETANTQQQIAEVCDGIKELLLKKNKAYGNSALKPINVFSKLDSTAGILQRIDDKIARIQNNGFNGDSEEDTLNDLIGYLILLKVTLKNK